jgi:hypothetical protein
MTRFSFERAMGVLLLMLTVIFSLMLVRSPGTVDVTTFLNWTEVVYENGLVAGYSKVVSVWSEYPPISFAILYIARAFGNTMGLSPLISFKVTILTFQLMSTGMILLLSGNYWVAAAFNASILLSGVALGYMDVCVAPPLIAAFWAFRERRNVLGTALFLIACLIKFQPLIVVPFIGVYLFEISNLRSCRGVVGRRLFWQLVILVAVTIAVFNLLFGVALARSLWRALNQSYLSGNALNLPWVGGFLYKVLFSSSFSMRAELIVVPPRSIYLLPFKIIFWSCYITVVIRAMRVEKTFRSCLLFSIVGLLTYVIWNPGVHENHLFVAVILAYMLMLHERTREHWEIVTILAVMFNINLFVFYGVTGTELQSPVVGVDLSIILAMLYAVAWLLLVVYVWKVARPRKEGERAEKETHLPVMVSN